MGRSRTEEAARLVVLQPQGANKRTFVDFWSARYQYGSEPIYDANIGRPLTESRIFDLFMWKNGTPLSAAKRKSVKLNFVDRTAELARFGAKTRPAHFLTHFATGGAIWRIFWLHCWRQRYPIFDQHVYRAMRYIEMGQLEEIPAKDPDKVSAYLREYLPFHRQFAALDGRAVDKALWAFGKFIGENNFPLRVSPSPNRRRR